jgi:hypothetical protein
MALKNAAVCCFANDKDVGDYGTDDTLSALCVNAANPLRAATPTSNSALRGLWIVL